jgi:hypothetical protein
MHLMNEVTNQAKNTPAQVLQHLIDEQRHAMRLNETTLLLSEPYLQGLVEDTQNRVLSHDKLFVEAVLREQKSEFDSRLSQPGLEECQDKWNDSLSLYYRGYDLAEEASQELKRGFAYWPVAVVKQKSALRYWKQALLKLQPKKGPQQQTDSQHQPRTRSGDSVDARNIRVLLEQMDAQDAQLNEGRALKGGDRPW